MKNRDTEATKKEELSFLQHLDILRWHIIRSFLAVVVLAIGAFVFKEIVFDKIILAPKDGAFLTNKLLCQLGHKWNLDNICIDNVALKIVNIKLSGQFMMHMYISLFAGLIAAMPYILWEIWRFIKPALHQGEKRNSRGIVVISSMLFYFGVLFSYYIVVPLTINFFGNYEVSTNVENTITLNSYVSTIVSACIGIGIVFELPIIAYFLSKIGLISPGWMRRKRKIMLVVILILSAIITPADVFSMFLVAIPLLLLYEISILIANRIHKKQLARENNEK